MRIPFPNPRPKTDANFTLAYSKPVNINVVGSYARKTAIQTENQLGIDLAVTMPLVRLLCRFFFEQLLMHNKSIFQDKDYLNYRYFHKRAYYLACLATAIEEAEECTFVIKYVYQHGNHLQPIITVSPGTGDDDFSRSNCQIRIVLAANGAIFPMSKTLPDNNCVRMKTEEANTSDNSAMPTPFYNASLRTECSSLAYLKFLHGASLQSIGFANACVLGSVWLRQRGMRTSLSGGGFGAFEWACMMALLLQGGGHKGKPILSKGYSSYQLFKATLQFLAVTDLVAKPLLVKAEFVDVTASEYPVLFDGARGMNILYKMTPWSYAMLRHNARGTLDLFDDPLSDHFHACFIASFNDPKQKFGSIVLLSLRQICPSASQTTDAISEDLAFCGRAYQALKTGLGDRVSLIDIEPPEMPAWSPMNSKQHTTRTSRIQVGLLLNPEQSNRTVDRGPSAEDKEKAAAFRKFWGEKAELRRFKDGSIQESLIWPQKDPQETVLEQVVTYIIRRHVGEEAVGGSNLIGEALERLLPYQSITSAKARAVHQPGVTGYEPVMTAFEVLEKAIRSLKGLPLQIRQILPAHSQLCYTSTRLPILNPSQCQMDPANVHVQFEGSNRWPDDIEAVQRTKIAFLLKMGEILEEATPNLSARPGLENTDCRMLNNAFVDIVYPSGAIFRLRVHHEGELHLLERTLRDRSHTQASRDEADSAISTYKRNFVHAPLHTQALRILSTRFPLLSPCIRLMKTWRDSHLLSTHISDELIELLTIRTFKHPVPGYPPDGTMPGFLRTLAFVAKWDWRSEPLIVDCSEEERMDSKAIDDIKFRFEALRKLDPARNRVAIFAASNIDPKGVTWTELGPFNMIAARFTSLARAAAALAKEQGLAFEPQALFVPSMADYDFVIHLAPKFARGQHGAEKAVEPVFRNLQTRTQEDRSRLGFNPVRTYVDELRKLYGSNIVFFYNSQGGSVIAGLWNPQTGPRPWKIGVPYNTIPLASSGDGEGYVSINKKTTLHDIARLGGDLLSRIEVKK